MHAGVQEFYKHSVPEIKGGGMDVFRLGKGVDVGDWGEGVKDVGWRERINVSSLCFDLLVFYLYLGN